MSGKFFILKFNIEFEIDMAQIIDKSIIIVQLNIVLVIVWKIYDDDFYNRLWAHIIKDRPEIKISWTEMKILYRVTMNSFDLTFIVGYLCSSFKCLCIPFKGSEDSGKTFTNHKLRVIQYFWTS